MTRAGPLFGLITGGYHLVASVIAAVVNAEFESPCPLAMPSTNGVSTSTGTGAGASVALDSDPVTAGPLR
jgi:hypothetical protein